MGGWGGRRVGWGTAGWPAPQRHVFLPIPFQCLQTQGTADDALHALTRKFHCPCLCCSWAPHLYRRLYSWNSVPNSPIQDAMARQEEFVRKEFDDRYNQVGGAGGGPCNCCKVWL